MKRINITDALIAFFAAMLLNFGASFLLFEKLGILAIGISEVLLLLPAAFLIYKRKQSPSERFFLKLPTVKSFFGSVFLFAGIIAIQSGVMFLLYPIYYKTVSNPDISMLDSVNTGASPFIILIFVAVIPAICEELLFRGYLRSAFEGRGKASLFLSILIPSLLFAAAHMSLYKLPATLIMGLGLGYMAYKTGSVLLPIIFHFLASARSLISYFSLKSGEASTYTETVVFKDMSYVYIALISLGIGALLCFVAIRLYSRNKLSFGKKLLAAIICLGICFGAGAMFVSNETQQLLETYRNKEVENGEVITETFSCSQNTPCSFNGVFSFDEGVSVDISIKDSEGEVVYERIQTRDDIILLEKGEYLLELAFSVDEDASGKNATYQINITGFAGYELINS